MKPRTLSALLCLLLAAAPAAAQGEAEISEDDYKQMMEQAMKSRSFGGQRESQSWDARLKVVSGSVMVRTVDSDEWSAITGEMPLDPNDVVKTAADGIAELYLDDKGAISLGRNTELEISSLDQEDAVLSLNFGSMVAKVKHFLNEKFKFQVRTPAAVCAIRGTEFAVEYSQLGREAAMAVFDEGRLQVTQGEDGSGAAGQEFTLEKNSEIVFGPSQKRFRPVPLSRMGRHRGALGGVRKRLPALKGWKPRSAAKRAELRSVALKRKIIRRQIGGAGKARPVKKGVRRKAGTRVRSRSRAPADGE